MTSIHVTGSLMPGGTFAISTLPAGSVSGAVVTVGGYTLATLVDGRYTVPRHVSPGSTISVVIGSVLRTFLVEDPGSTTWIIPLTTQSNMHNRISTDAAADATAWPSGVQFATPGGRLVSPSGSMAVPVGTGSFILAKHFAIDFLADHPDDEIVFIPGAVSSTGFAGNHWNPGDSLYKHLVGMVDAIMLNNPSYRLRCVLYQGGENDAQAATAALTYRAQLAAFVAGLRGDLQGGFPELPFVFGEMPSSFIGSNSARIAIRDEVLSAPTRIAHSAVASSRTPTVLAEISAVHDTTHFNTAACIELGKRHYAALAVADANTLS